MAAPRKNYDEAVKMYEGGISVPKIAAHFGVGNTSMYKILKRRGVVVRQPTPGLPCKVEGCNEPVKARGYCSRHTYQFYKHGKIISAGKMKDPSRKCSVPGCNRKHKANGYCEAHNQQFKKYSRITSQEIVGRNGKSYAGSKGSSYILIMKKDHPMANKRGYVRRSHLAWEKHTGHIVTPPEVIHHKNGNKHDDRCENLELFSCDEEHQRKRHRLKGVFGVIKGGIIK